jgi:hypothetical protein
MSLEVILPLAIALPPAVSKGGKTTGELEHVFIVGTAIGIRSSVDSTDYIQLYDGNADTLAQSLHRIQAAAKRILSALPLETRAIADHETSGIAP